MTSFFIFYFIIHVIQRGSNIRPMAKKSYNYNPSDSILKPKISTLLCVTCRKRRHHLLSNISPQHAGRIWYQIISVSADTASCRIGIRHKNVVSSHPWSLQDYLFFSEIKLKDKGHQLSNFSFFRM